MPDLGDLQEYVTIYVLDTVTHAPIEGAHIFGNRYNDGGGPNFHEGYTNAGGGWFIENYFGEHVPMHAFMSVEAAGYISNSISFTQSGEGSGDGYVYLTKSCDGVVCPPGQHCELGYCIDDPTPVPSSINPISGPNIGGTLCTIEGNDFYPGCTVKFGTAESPLVTWIDYEHVTAVSPAHAAGIVDVIVLTNGGGKHGTLTNAFTFTKPPAIAMHMHWENSDGSIIYDLDNYFKDLSRIKRGQEITSSIYLHNMDSPVTGVTASTIMHPTDQVGRPEDTYLAMTLSFNEEGPYYTTLDVGNMTADEVVQIYVKWIAPVAALTGNVKCAIHAEGRCVI